MDAFLALYPFVSHTYNMKKALLLSLILWLSACTMSPTVHLDFAKIKMGMVKSKVIEVAGPPFWSDRHLGVDRWFYYLKPEDRQTERVVYFRNGKVFQKGERIKPILTADEVEELKKPRLKKMEPFKPSMTEEQLRKEIKKEIKKNKSSTKQPKYESL